MKIIKKYYHWIVFAILLLEQMIYGGLLNNLNGMFVIPVSKDFGIPRTLFSLAISLRAIFAFLSTLFSGVMKRFANNKQLMVVGIFAAAVSCLILGVSRNVAVLSVGFALMGVCEGFCMTAAVTRILTRWFHTHQGALLGAVTAGTGVGGSIICGMLTYAIEWEGWRAGFFASGLLFFALAVLMLLFLKDGPDCVGVQPFGSGIPIRKSNSHGKLWGGPVVADVVRMPVFYLLLASLLFAVFSAQMGMLVVIPFFQDCGFKPEQTAILQSVLMLILAAAKLGVGFATDSFGARVVMVVCMVMCACGILLMIAANSFFMGILAMVVFGVGLPITTVMIPLLTRELLGYHSHDALLGVYLSMQSVAALLAGYIPNIIYDIWGSYHIGLYGAIGLMLCSLLLMLIVFCVTKRIRKRA